MDAMSVFSGHTNLVIEWDDEVGYVAKWDAEVDEGEKRDGFFLHTPSGTEVSIFLGFVPVYGRDTDKSVMDFVAQAASVHFTDEWKEY